MRQNLRRKYHFRYVVDTLKALNREERLFSYSWFDNSMPDEAERDAGATLDAHLHEFLIELERSSLLNETAIVLVSESASPPRGSSFFAFSSVEDLLLAGLFWLPPSFAEELPLKMENLRSNSKSLITARDLHATLLDLIDSLADEELKKKKAAHSLLSGLVPDRACYDVGIPIPVCACLGRIPMDVEGRLARSFSQAVILRANSRSPPNGTEWKLGKINGVVRLYQGSSWTDIFEISIRAIPKADVEAIARYSSNASTWEFLSDLNIVSRIDHRDSVQEHDSEQK